MTFEELREMLGSTEAWEGLMAAVTRLALTPPTNAGVLFEAIDFDGARKAFCDDRARTIAQALAGEQAALDSVKARRGQR